MALASCNIGTLEYSVRPTTRTICHADEALVAVGLPVSAGQRGNGESHVPVLRLRYLVDTLLVAIYVGPSRFRHIPRRPCM